MSSARLLGLVCVFTFACADDKPVADPDDSDQGVADGGADVRDLDGPLRDGQIPDAATPDVPVPDAEPDVPRPDVARPDAGPVACEITIDGEHVCALSVTEFVCVDFARCYCTAVADQLFQPDVERCVDELFEMRGLQTLADFCHSAGTSMGDVVRGEWQEAVGLNLPLVGTPACDDLAAVNPECNHDTDCPGDEVCQQICDDNCYGYPARGCCDRACVADPAPYVCEAQPTRQCGDGQLCPDGFVQSADFGEFLWDCPCCLAEGCDGFGSLVCNDHPSCQWTPQACNGFCSMPNLGACADR